jgi:hypothetical protein
MMVNGPNRACSKVARVFGEPATMNLKIYKTIPKHDVHTSNLINAEMLSKM